MHRGWVVLGAWRRALLAKDVVVVGVVRHQRSLQASSERNGMLLERVDRVQRLASVMVEFK